MEWFELSVFIMMLGAVVQLNHISRKLEEIVNDVWAIRESLRKPYIEDDEE